MVKLPDVCDRICEKVGFTREVPGKRTLTKRELLAILAWVDLRKNEATKNRKPKR